MINERSCEAVAEGYFGQSLVEPRYQDYCFSNIPGSIARLLLNGSADPALPSDCFGASYPQVDRVVSIFLDALGWKFIKEFDHPLLRLMEAEGCCSMLTAQFPSTTAAQVTTLATGVPVGRSGVYEWWFRHETVGDLISPLTFQMRVGATTQSLRAIQLTTSEVFPMDSLSLTLARRGISSAAIIPEKIVDSIANAYLSRGSSRYGFKSLDDLNTVAREVNTSIKNGHIAIYIDDLDSTGHRCGPQSSEFVDVRNRLLDVVEELVRLFRDGRTLIMIFGDHGQIATTPANPETNCMLDLECPELLPYLIKDASGEPLPPAGGMRDVFLHIDPQYLDQAQALLTERLSSRAAVMLTEEAISRSWFGVDISDVFRRRVGNLLVLPQANRSIRWSTHAKSREKHLGDHGGLHRDEMEVAFLTLV